MHDEEEDDNNDDSDTHTEKESECPEYARYVRQHTLTGQQLGIVTGRR